MRGRGTALLIGALSVGVVVGFMLGGVGPRRELAARDREIAELEEALTHAEPRGAWRSPVPGLDRILRSPPSEEREADGASRERGAGGDGEHASESEEPGPDGGVRTWRERWRDRRSERGPDDVLESFERAARVQDVRRTQSRAALVEQAGLDDEETAALDEELRAMNEELVGHGEELLVLALDDEPPPARDLLGITHDVTGVLHRAQLRLEAILGPDRARAVDPTALEIWNHVDLGELEPAARAAAERTR